MMNRKTPGARRSGEKLMRGIGRMFRTTGLHIGYRYEDSPICVPDGTPPSSDHPEDYEPSARPGSRAPHVGEDRSTLDLFGHGFVLLQIGPDAPDVSVFEAIAAASGLPLTTVAVARQDLHDLYERRLGLVRPDGHVAWR